MLEFFVLEVTARSVADLLQIHPNTAALFYKKIRQVITHHLQQESIEMFDGCVEMDESYFGGKRKGKRVEVRQEKSPFLASSSARDESTRWWSATPQPTDAHHFP